VAFIGPSGSGKSTLADLIIGINEPSSGEIDYFTKSSSVIKRDNIGFGYVPQNPGRIYGTIKENIGFGLDEIQDDLLAQAIDGAHLSDVVNNLESGFEFHTGEQSDDLSGGQMQRIGLARALYSKPNILLLDEATSALDVEIEAAVSKSLEKLRGSCTIVVIAHRLSTVKNADVVFVVDEGKILAHGKFAELVKTNDLVARFVELSNLSTN
jgi:ATP-binding cassette subfamily C protein